MPHLHVVLSWIFNVNLLSTKNLQRLPPPKTRFQNISEQVYEHCKLHKYAWCNNYRNRRLPPPKTRFQNKSTNIANCINMRSVIITKTEVIVGQANRRCTLSGSWGGELGKDPNLIKLIKFRMRVRFLIAARARALDNV
ncbi:uncharacterized protein LOC143216928 [Lasioglossum baleicum]|uniref:uncharacterized protein LOC143216928 n=1 Tax=Lasioglossum baleicum TaxID=434251 RepID=UPI003FCC9E54